ncbi:Phospholipase C [Schaereria dolodes]|nr:Phospholipase C [Schaereria dolodes]
MTLQAQMASSPTTEQATSNGIVQKSPLAGSPFARIPKPYIVTAVALTVTPASANPFGAAAFSAAPSSTASPSNASIQSSPEGLQGRNTPSTSFPSPLQLPESPFGSPSAPGQSAMSEAVAMSKCGLIRRISRGAAKKLTRRRQSSNTAASRDHSSGPVIMRRRSGSRSGTEADVGVTGVGLGEDDDEVLEEQPSIHGLGLLGDGVSSDTQTLSRKSSRTEGGIAPIVPPILRQGTTLTKVTKRKRKTLTFVLDTDSAKVTWNPANSSKRFYIDDIQQIRLQGDARNYREEFQISADLESVWFTIIYADQDRVKGRPLKTMHLIAPSQHIFELWTSTLDDLSRYRHDLMTGLAGSGQDEKTLRGHWKREMARTLGEGPRFEDEENLDLGGVQLLCRSLHINCSKNMLRAHFEKADTGGTGKLNFEEFKDFVRRLKERTDIKKIHKHLANETSDGLNLNTFLHFLRHTQGIDIDSNRTLWQNVFMRFVRKANVKSPTISEFVDENSLQMSSEAFSAFLCSKYNNVFLPLKESEMKLDRPLNEYFISSSHNTYLLGRQVAGNSSTEAYIRALQRACRCVEIDCWDGPDGKPIVSHGHTMTSSVLFADCISVIGKYAFEKSQYPLILSLEVHCNGEQQQVMVDIMIKGFKDRLVREPILANPLSLPSPEELRNKILIKVKAGDNMEDKDLGLDTPAGRRQRSFSSPFSRPQILDNTFIPTVPLLSSPISMSPPDKGPAPWGLGSRSITTTSMSSATDDSDTAYGGTLRPRRSSTKRKSKIIKSLSDLAIYTRGLKFDDFSNKAYNHVYSVAERQFDGLCRDQDSKAQLEKHNMRYLMRVYPSAFRMRSTNPDPLVFWRRGAQMVALNWQTYDLGMQMNEAMFASGSDQSGYVLKPKELRQPTLCQSCFVDKGVLGRVRTMKKLIRFSVDLISAQQVPRPRGVGPDEHLNPYVEIEMFSAEDKARGVATGEGGQNASARNGLSGIGSPHRRRSRVVPSNGYNPIFEDKFKLSLETKYPSLVFVRWTVWDSQDGRSYLNNANSEPLATFTAKLSSLEQGYRHLPLYDHNGDQFLFATLFCRIMKEEPVTIEREEVPVSEKGGKIRQLLFKRTMSVERGSSKDDQ